MSTSSSSTPVTPIAASSPETEDHASGQVSSKLGLRGRLILLLIAAFSLLGGMVAWDFVRHRAERIEAATTELLGNARLIAARQQSIVARADAILNGLMLSPELRPGVAVEACSQALAARLGQEVEILQIGKVLPNGELACAGLPATARVNVADRPWFQHALRSREMVVSDIWNGGIAGKTVVTFGKAVPEGKAVVYVDLDLAWLQQALASASLPESARLVLVDARGTVAVRSPDPEGWVGKSAAHLPLFQRIRASDGEGTTADLGLDGKPRLFAYATLLDTVSGPMYVWLAVPNAVIEAPARREAMLRAGMILAVLMGTLGVVVLGGNRLLLRPLLTLSRVAARFGAGDLGARTGLRHGSDEIGLLARTIDAAADVIADRERKLAGANRALRVLSAGNRTLLRAKGEQELLEEMCRAIVQAGGYRIAWVGYAGQDLERGVRVVAAYGVERDVLDGLQLVWDDTESGWGPPGTAIRRGIPVASNDIPADAGDAPWRELAQRYGYASSLALPLRIDGAVVGVLNICAVEPDAFDDHVVELLSESVDDLAFGIATQRAAVEHQRTRAALQTAEDRFRAAADASLDALYILKSVRGERGEIVDFEFIDLNARAEQMLGIPRGQVVGQKLCELLPINRSRGFFDKYVGVATTGTPLEEEVRLDTPATGAQWLRQQVVRVGDGVAISSRDVTAWKQVHAAIRRLEVQNTQILNAAGEGLFGVDTQGRVTFINPAGAALLQTTAEALCGKDMHARHHHSRSDGTPYPDHECPVYAAFRDGVVHRGSDEVFWRKDGTSFPVEYISTPISGEDGKPVGAVVSFSDITGRKANEKALTRASRALRTLSAGNEALVRATDEPALLSQVCRVIVEKGGYRMAWVGYVDDHPERTVAPKAWAGVADTSLADSNLSWSDTERGAGPIGLAVRDRAPQVAHDIMADPSCARWHEQAATQGYAAVFACPLAVGERTIGVLAIYAAETEAFDADERELLEELADDLAFGIETLRTRAERDRIAYAHAHHGEILQRSLEQSIQAIAYTVEARDPYTAGHERRVAELAVAIARELGLSEERIHGIRLAGSIHDLGKIHVPAEILARPGKLTDIEFMLIKTHPQAGYDILKDVGFPWPIADIVRQHHEKMDGSGYPQGLKGGQILLESRIMTVADVVEAMASHRPYRPAKGIAFALTEIERGRGSAYDTAVADACLNLFREGRFAFQE